MAKSEVRQRVADARARLAALRKQAADEAADEALLAEEDAKAQAKARLAAVNERGKVFDDAVADYEYARDAALLEAEAYYEVASQAQASLDAVQAAYVSLNQLLRPHGFLADQAEEPHDRNKPSESLVFLVHGDDSAALRKKLGLKVEGVQLDELRGVVAAKQF